MAKKEFTYRGKSTQEIKNLSPAEFAEIAPCDILRRIKKGFTVEQKRLLKSLEVNKGIVKTHCRDMPILPVMIGRTIRIHRGNSFEQILIAEDMIGHRLGEFALSRKKTSHSAPGVGATKSSSGSSKG